MHMHMHMHMHIHMHIHIHIHIHIYIYIQTYACTDFWTLRRHVALPELYTFKDTSAETSYPILRGDAAVPKAL